MVPLRILCSLIPLCLVVAAVEQVASARDDTVVASEQACTEITSLLLSSASSSKVLESPLNLDFQAQTTHWFYESSTQTPACVVEPASPEDVASVMSTIAKYNAPFAVRSGGHASNPGFSSTTGVHISLKHMDQIVVSEDKSEVEIGYGLIWTDVYSALQDEGVNVVGGRVSGPGVGGFTLGGGYSWKTNQFGLTSDTVKLFNVVLPNATITTASKDFNEDLFWALKGGLNKFGVVTSAVYYTHKQSDTVYAGLAYYTGDSAVEAVLRATLDFSDSNTDPKAQIITTLDGALLGLSRGALVLFFYDGPDPGASFDAFDGVLPILKLVYRQPFVAFVRLVEARLQTSPRGSFNSFSTTGITRGFLDAVKNQSDTVNAMGLEHGSVFLSYDIEPFLAYGEYATDSAYPHSDSPIPLNVYFAWNDESQDEFWLQALQTSVDELKQVAIDEGIYDEDSAVVYPNYAPSTATAEQLYGADGAARLRSIRDAIDPDRVMDLAGGFSI